MANRFCPQFYRFISFQTENKVFLSKSSVHEINTNYTNSVYSPLDWLGKFYLGRFAVMNCDVYNEYLLLQIFANWIWQFLRRKCEQGAHFAVSVCDKSTIKFAKIHILPNWPLPTTYTVQCNKIREKNSVITSGCTIKINVFWKIWKNFPKHFEFSLFKKVCNSTIMSPKIVPFFHFRPHCSHVAFQKGRFFREIQDTNLS